MHHFTNKIEFYITNVCNLTCEHCNRFNNYRFSGWQKWQDYEHIYQKWSEFVVIPAIVLLGGEPLLNPTIVDWIEGCNRIFKCDVQVLTNGTRLNHVPNLYESQLLKIADIKNHIGISLHSIDDWSEIHENIKTFLRGKITEEGPLVNKDPSCWGSAYTATDSNGVYINVYTNDHFNKSAITKIEDRFYLHDNNPTEAHAHCGFARWKCYHMIRGKLYKCGPVALLPEFAEQFSLQIADQDLDLLRAYQPLTVDNYPDFHQEFFAKLDNPLPQCKFCPTAKDDFQIKLNPLRKGVVL